MQMILLDSCIPIKFLWLLWEVMVLVGKLPLQLLAIIIKKSQD